MVWLVWIINLQSVLRAMFTLWVSIGCKRLNLVSHLLNIFSSWHNVENVDMNDLGQSEEITLRTRSV